MVFECKGFVQGLYKISYIFHIRGTTNGDLFKLLPLCYLTYRRCTEGNSKSVGGGRAVVTRDAKFGELSLITTPVRTTIELLGNHRVI